MRRARPSAAVLADFDAGTWNLNILAERHGYTVEGVRQILLRHGRKPLSRKEAAAKLHAKRRARGETCPAKMKPFYDKLRRSGLSRADALAAVLAEAARHRVTEAT